MLCMQTKNYYFIRAFAISLFLFSLCFFTAGCLNGKTAANEEFVPMPYIRFDPVLTLEMINKFGTSDETELCEVIFSKTADMSAPFKRFRLNRGPRVEFSEFAAGDVFYVGAFIDLSRDLVPTYGVDPVGGAYASDFDPDNGSKVEIFADRTTEVEIRILRPISGRSPTNGYFGTAQIPSFSWNAITGIGRFEITVYDKISAAPEWRALIYGNSISYGKTCAGGTLDLIKAEPLEADRKHYWTLTGFDSNNQAWAYGKEMSFLP